MRRGGEGGVPRQKSQKGAPTAMGEGPSRPAAPSFAGIDELETLEVGTPSVSLVIAAASDVGRVRSNNEDAFSVVDVERGIAIDAASGVPRSLGVGPRGVVLAVADGMGGANAGEVASALALEVLGRELLIADSTLDPADALRLGAEAANARVHAQATSPDRQGMGATLSAVLVRDGMAYTAEIGDSRIYVLRAGVLRQISVDQTYARALLEQGVFTPEEMKTSRANHVILQACGNGPDVVVAQRRVALRDDDLVLVCSDGLSGQVDDLDIAALITTDTESVAEACRALVGAANARGGEDNATVILARVKGAAPPNGVSIAATTTLIRPFALVE